MILQLKISNATGITKYYGRKFLLF